MTHEIDDSAAKVNLEEISAQGINQILTMIYKIEDRAFTLAEVRSGAIEKDAL